MLTGAVLGADVRDALLAPAVLTDGRRLPYALGLEITTVGGRDVYLHSGQIDGFRSALAYLIDGGVGVAVLANRDDTFPAEIAVRIVERLTGVAAPPRPARLPRRAALAAQPAVTGMWYSPELDIHVAIGAADDGAITRAGGNSGYRYAAMSDGSWFGVGSAASTRLRRVGDELWRDEIVGDEPAEVFVRTGEPPPAAAPAGTYHSEELRAYATFADVGGGPPGAAAVTIGLARPRAVAPVSDGVWAGDGVTIRLLPAEAALEISLYGARRCRFSRVDRAPPPRQRGL
jgi:hypothetical protein